MRRPRLLVAAAAAIAVATAGQVVAQHISSAGDAALGALTQPPAVAPGTDALAGLRVVAQRVRGSDYRRAAFGEAWDDDTTAPGGHNGCDTRNDILDRDLVQKSYTATARCPRAVAGGTLRDPYTDQTIAFVRGNQVGASVQIDHIVPLAFAWDMGARDWTDAMRRRFANDPANLIAVAGQANQDKGDLPPGEWMPPNGAFACQYALQFAAVLRGYGLAVDAASADRLKQEVAGCPVAGAAAG